MATLDPNNYIKLFRLEETEGCDNVVVIPARKNVLQTMFNTENPKDRRVVEKEDVKPEVGFPEEGVNLLIKFRHELEELFKDCGDISGIAAVLWEDISRRLFERGFRLSGKHCAAKWEALYSEYVEIARSDDEGRVSGWKRFAEFECLYKLRTQYIDSKILEDITEYLNSRPGGPSTPDKTGITMHGALDFDQKIEPSGNKFSDRILAGEDFSTLSNDQEESQMLIEAINAAEKILEDNLRESDDKPSEETEDNGMRSPGGAGAAQDEKKVDLSGAKNALKTVRHLPVRREREDNQVFVRSENAKFYWDTDATQCFLDLRLYVETSRETKLCVLRKYRSIVAFVSQKMLLNGYQVSEIDCKKKWDQLLRYYNKEVKRATEILAENDSQGARKYYWQMDKVLRKSGVERSADDNRDFCWDQESVRKLIAIRIPMENAFAMFKRYVILWQYVASQMAKNKFLPTYNECSIKWMELCEIYQVCLESLTKGISEEEMGWEFYRDMRQGFEQNAKSTEAVINYKCGTGPYLGTENQGPSVTEVREKCTLNSVPSAETPANLQNSTEISIRRSNPSKTTNNCSETNLTDTARDEPEAQDLPRCDNIVNTKFLIITNLNSTKIEDNLQTNSAKPTTTCSVTPAAPLPKLSERNLSIVRIPELKARSRTADREGNVGWTEEATVLLIKLKLSRELEFRSPSFVELDLWKEIATDMQSAGHNVCHESCANRWYKLKFAYGGNASPKTGLIIRPEYREQLNLTELPFSKEIRVRKSTKRKKNTDSTDSKPNNKFEWTEAVTKTFVGLRFSEGIRDERKYGWPLARKMQAAGYPNIAPTDATRKWARMNSTYRKALFRKEMGETVRWQYFELVDSYMRGELARSKESEVKNEAQPFFWTPEAVQKLIDLKLSMENLPEPLGGKGKSLIWQKVADAMVAEGFQVTKTGCSVEWNFLIEAYKKTKRELTEGNGAVIGKYFIMMDEALDKLKRFNNKTEETEEPIDFSITRKRRKLGDGETEKQAQRSLQKHDESPRKKSPNNNIPVNANVRSFHVRNPNEKQKDSSVLGSVADEIQEEVNYRGDKISTNDSSKENMAWSAPDTRGKTSSAASVAKREDTHLRIPCTQKVYNETPSGDGQRLQYLLMNRQVLSPRRKNILIQDRAVNSTEHVEEEETGTRWSEGATRLLINLKQQHNEKLVDFPRPGIEWENVAARLERLGYNYSQTECREKWYSLKTAYEKKIAEMRAKRSVQTWPYFEEVDKIYKNVGNFHTGFRSILPKKRPQNDKTEDVIPAKKLIISNEPSATFVTPILTIFDIANSGNGLEMIVDREETIE